MSLVFPLRYQSVEKRLTSKRKSVREYALNRQAVNADLLRTFLVDGAREIAARKMEADNAR